MATSPGARCRVDRGRRGVGRGWGRDPLPVGLGRGIRPVAEPTGGDDEHGREGDDSEDADHGAGLWPPSEVQRGQVAEPAPRPLDGVPPSVPVERPFGFDHPGRAPGGSDVVPAAPGADGEAAKNAAPSVVASTTGEISTGRPLASARAWTNVGLRLMPPSIRKRRDLPGAVVFGRVDQVGAPMGDAFEHGPHDLRPSCPAGEAEQACPGRRSPRRVCPDRAARARTSRRRFRRTATRCRATRRSSR